MGVYDVCIVGGGPAGLAATCVLASAGLKVVCVSGRRSDSPTNIGETLSPLAVKTLSELGAETSFGELQFRPVSGFQSTWGSERISRRQAIISPHGGGWLVDRPTFQRMLSVHAQRKGAELRDANVKRVESLSGKWRICAEAPQSEHETLEASFVVYATGRLGQRVSPLPGRRLAVDKLVACVLSVPSDAVEVDARVYVDSLTEGWLYSVQPSTSSRIVSFFTDGDLLTSPRTPSDIITMFCERLDRAPSISGIVSMAMLRNASHASVMSAATLFRPVAHGERWIACGDAAQTLDPLSSMGIAHALHDGVQAAHVVRRTMEGDSQASARRENARRSEFIGYLSHRLAYYRSEMRWADSLFWVRRHRVVKFR